METAKKRNGTKSTLLPKSYYKNKNDEI